jgi:hypothetical protein
MISETVKFGLLYYTWGFTISNASPGKMEITGSSKTSVPTYETT